MALIDVPRGEEREALQHAELAATAEPGLPMPAFVRGALAYIGRRYGEALGPLTEARRVRKRSAQPRDLHFMIGDSLARLEGRRGRAVPEGRGQVVSGSRARARQPRDAVSVDGPLR